MLCIDANIILRYILEDHTELSVRANTTIQTFDTKLEKLLTIIARAKN
jgi:predicted nucleic acid-binding protein